MDRGVVAAGHPEEIVKNMSLDLNHIHYDISPNKNCRRGWTGGRRPVPRSKEEIF
jgi:hypothetical protein